MCNTHHTHKGMCYSSQDPLGCQRDQRAMRSLSPGEKQSLCSLIATCTNIQTGKPFSRKVITRMRVISHVCV